MNGYGFTNIVKLLYTIGEFSLNLLNNIIYMDSETYNSF